MLTLINTEEWFVANLRDEQTWQGDCRSDRATVYSMLDRSKAHRRAVQSVWAYFGGRPDQPAALGALRETRSISAWRGIPGSHRWKTPANLVRMGRVPWRIHHWRSPPADSWRRPFALLAYAPGRLEFALRLAPTGHTDHGNCCPLWFARSGAGGPPGFLINRPDRLTSIAQAVALDSRGQQRSSVRLILFA